jgi:hypothetical protein
VITVEPSAAMRERSVCRDVLAGDAARMARAGACVDAAWISTVVHHMPDLTAAAHELRRVLRLGALVLIRSAPNSVAAYCRREEWLATHPAGTSSAARPPAGEIRNGWLPTPAGTSSAARPPAGGTKPRARSERRAPGRGHWPRGPARGGDLRL